MATSNASKRMRAVKDSKILKYLEQYIVTGKGSKCTHTSINTKCKYDIPPEKLSEFYAVYAKHIGNENLSITERPTEVSHLKYDLDLEYCLSDTSDTCIKESPLTLEKDVRDIVDLIQNTAHRVFKIECDDEDTLQAFVLRRPGVRIKNGVLKDGLHIHFPKFFLEKKKAEFLFNKVLESFIEKDPLKKFMQDPYYLKGDYSTILDKGASISNVWTLHGSTKINNDKVVAPYELVAIFDKKAKSIRRKLSQAKKNKPALITQLSVRRGKDTIAWYSTGIHREFETNQWKKRRQPHPIKKLTAKEQEAERVSLKELLELLNDRRASVYDQWWRVGAAIHSVLPNETGLALFDEFSSRVKNYDKESVKNHWTKYNSQGTNRITKSALIWWVREDNQKGYEAYRMNCKDTHDRIWASCQTKTFEAKDVAKMLMNIYGDKHCFITPRSGTNYWMYFKQHRWHRDGGDIELRNVISETMPKIFLDQRKRYVRRQGETDDADEDRVLESCAAECRQLSRKLTKKSTIMEIKFHCEQENKKSEEELEHLLDSNRNLIGFNDGVLEIDSETGESSFRAGRPEDWITKTVGYNYPGKYDPNCAEAIAFTAFRNSIHPGKHAPIGRYLWAMMAMCLNGYTKQQFPIFVGDGANGKSIFTTIMSLVLGQYYCTLPPSLLTQKRGKSGDASPDLYKTKGARFVILQEPDFDDNFNVGLLKELTGGDQIYCRKLYGDPIHFVPQFLIGMTCNKLPSYTDPTNGTRRRMRNITFPVTFTDTPEKTKGTEDEPIGKLDGSLKKKCQTWTPVVMAYLIHLYPRIIKSTYYQNNEEPEIPSAVRHSTDAYAAKCNIVRRWIEKELEFITDIDGADPDSFILSENDGFQVFKEWCYLKNYRAKNEEFEEETKHEFKRRNVKLNEHRAWVGVRVRDSHC